MKTQSKPTFIEETIQWNIGTNHVLGIDEVGRGSFAGPIVASAVIYKPNFYKPFLDRVNDSKLLKPNVREELSKYIKENSIWEIESVGIDFINKYGIGKANIEVFNKLIEKLLSRLGISKYFLLIDGFDLKIPNQKAIVKGDQKSLSIASASILAKVYRDNLMKEYAGKYPNYSFEINKGYGTLKHRNAIKEFGICDIHRTAFIKP